MKHNSEDEQTLIKIQHEWAEARLKRDSSFPQRIEADDFTVVWFNGTIVSKEEDLKSYESTDTVFTDFKIVVGQGSIKAHTKTQDLSGKYVWTDTFVKQRGAWTAAASQVTPVVQK